MVLIASSDANLNALRDPVGFFEMEKVRNTSATLRSCLKGSQIRNIDGKIVGKDGKPMMPMRHETSNGGTVHEETVTVTKSLKDDTDRTFFEAWEDPNVGAMKTTYGNDAHESNENPNLASKRQGSFAHVLNNNPSSKSKFRSLLNSEKVENADVVLPLATFTAAQQRYANSLVGYFVGKNVAFPLVQNYVLEQGPWLIRNIPIILTKWSPNLVLTKDKVTKVPVWVKMHKVPVVAYSEDGLSLIATQIGKPVMLDAFTSTMCADPWGRMGYARALIEVSAEKELKQEVIMAVPEEEGIGHIHVKIQVEYEWKPPLCDECHVFGHNLEQCPKHVVEPVKVTMEQNTDGFTTVTNRKKKGKQPQTNQARKIEGLKLNKPKATFVYRPKISEPTRTMETTGDDIDLFKLKNQFDSLRDHDDLLKKMNIATWNIRGLNRTPKQSEVRHVVNENRLSICAILESHVDISALSKVMHVKIIHKVSGRELFCSFVYANNLPVARRSLWADLELHKNVTRGKPWILMGDFNVALNLEDYSSGPSKLNYAITDFKDCVYNIEVMDINSSGLHFTWNQKPKGGCGLLKKLDRIMGNTHNIEVTAQFVADVFVSRYQMFLRSDMVCDNLNMDGLFLKKFLLDLSPVRIIEEINHTLLSSYPKVSIPLKINDYRPISCCNVIYKCISKILTNRIIDGIKEVGPPRCAFKIDIQKAYDTVDWRFLGCVLKYFGFHPLMIKWIMACVTSTSFSLNINGDIHGFFKGKRGLRQGDPLSPYLFTLIMEVLTLMIKRRVNLSGVFRYHKHCEELQLVNVCFADDLFIFARGDLDSARVIMESLDEFKLTSGLVPSIPKSTAFFCNVPNHVKISILNIMPFAEGNLPVKYLGVPLISSRLLNKDCKVLVEKAKNRIEDWKNKSLSFAGRLQLCKSVISSLHVYWASVLIIPKGIIYDIQSLIRGFLWCNGEYKRGKAKVAWDDICLPKSEGGLGLRSLDLFNMALMTTHIWNIVSNKESLWVRWIHTYKLRNRSFWDLPIKDNVSWGWLKLLQLRVLVRPFFWVKLGNGRDTSVWHDSWCSHCPLSRFISPRDIYSEGFNNQAMVADFVLNNVWTWPQAWIAKAPILNLILAPNLDENTIDCIRWRDITGVFSKFSVSRAWGVFRPRGNEVNWFRIVWFPHSIPRHSFHLWLVMRNSLKTQDKLRQWDVGINTDLNLLRCSLCNTQSDSHAHLFFECPYSSKVWKLVRHLADMELVPPILYDIVDHLQPMANMRTTRSIFGKLILAASSYFVLLERNNRLFKNVKRTPEELRDVIMVTVCLKLLSFKFKNSANVISLLDRWKMPRSFRLYVC
ncbi:putative RNA-directed DNA polymerase [Tanacetum coccineum]